MRNPLSRSSNSSESKLPRVSPTKAPPNESAFVFDEVDAGVGGRAAIEVGRRLAALARSAQVLVVTHLPQVAAFADRHIVVERTEAGLVTSTEIDLVEGAARTRELSRMLAGHADSSLAHGHAEELLAAAAAAKKAG